MLELLFSCLVTLLALDQTDQSFDCFFDLDNQRESFSTIQTSVMTNLLITLYLVCLADDVICSSVAH